MYDETFVISRRVDSCACTSTSTCTITGPKAHVDGGGDRRLLTCIQVQEVYDRDTVQVQVLTSRVQVFVLVPVLVHLQESLALRCWSLALRFE